MEKTFKDRFGERLKERRKACGFSTVEKLADAISVRGQTISNYEGGKTLPDAENLSNLAAALGCTVDYLTLKEDDPTHEAASVAEQTGLSPDAASVLIEKSKTDDRSIQFFLNSVLTSEYSYDLGMSFFVLIDRIRQERERVKDKTTSEYTMDTLGVGSYFDFEHMIDGAKFSAFHAFLGFMDEATEKAKQQTVEDMTKNLDKAMGLDMEVDDGKGEE